MRQCFRTATCPPTPSVIAEALQSVTRIYSPGSAASNAAKPGRNRARPENRARFPQISTTPSGKRGRGHGSDLAARMGPTRAVGLLPAPCPRLHAPRRTSHREAVARSSNQPRGKAAHRRRSNQQRAAENRLAVRQAITRSASHSTPSPASASSRRELLACRACSTPACIAITTTKPALDESPR